MEIKAAAVAINGDNDENDGRKNNIVQALEKFRFEKLNKNSNQIKLFKFYFKRNDATKSA